MAEDKEEKPTSHDGNDNINMNCINKSEHNTSTVTTVANDTSSSEAEQKSQLEDDINKGTEEVCTNEDIELETVPMDTSDTDNTILVSNTNNDTNSLSETMKTKDSSSDTIKGKI